MRREEQDIKMESHSCDQICVWHQRWHEPVMIHNYYRPVSKQLLVCNGSDDRLCTVLSHSIPSIPMLVM